MINDGLTDSKFDQRDGIPDAQKMSRAPTVAIIDIGSNSIKLLVARSSPNNSGIEVLYTHTIETRISSGISQAHPRLSAQAIEAGTRTVTELLRLARAYQPDAVRIVATSAVRDARNGQEFTELIETQAHYRVDILDGPEEARLIARGLATDPELSTLNDYLQIDLGGGSLEVILLQKAQIQQAISLQLGAVRLSEQFLLDREAPIDQNTASAIQTHVCKTLETSIDGSLPSLPVVATGGAIVITRAILAAEDGLTIENRSACMTMQEISQLRQRIGGVPLHDRLAIPALPPARADILPTALLTIEAVLEVANADQLTHSFHNLRYGIAAELLETLR